MKYLVFLTCILATWSSVSAQNPATITLQECYVLAQQNYPLVKQRELIARSKDYSLSNTAKGSLPQFTIGGQATYQSDVTQIPVTLPGMDIPVVPKDQFRLYGEVTQPLTDLATVRHQKAIQNINSSIQEQSLEVELYKIKERINQLFFGTLLISEQLNQNELLKKDIQAGMTRVSAAINYGTELKSSLDKLKAELLRAEQRTIELKSSRQAYIDMLGLFINQTLSEGTILVRPESLAATDEITRPELKLYDYQKRSFEAQNKLINTRNMPKFSLFFQGGVGRPSPVNMLSNEFSPYYIGGLRLSWAITSFYTSGKERQLLAIGGNMIDIQKQTFLFNTGVTLRQQNAEINRLQLLINTDNEIIALRTSVKEASNAQLENGVITVNDFLREVNAEDQARQNRLLHEVQLLMAQYNYQTTVGE